MKFYKIKAEINESYTMKTKEKKSGSLKRSIK